MKLNIIFDGNYLMHKTKSIFMSYNKSSSLTEALHTVESRAEFLRKVITDLCSTTNQILNNTEQSELNSIVVVFDKDQNWRKQYYQDYKKKTIEDDGTEAVGKAHFYSIMAKVKSLLTSRGIVTSDVSTLEGDDLLWIWAKGFEKHQPNTTNIIVTADRDSVQIVSSKTSIYNNNSKQLRLYTLTETDVLRKKLDIDRVIVEPNEYLFKKILIGDKGDNIPNVTVGMGEKKVDSITSLVKELGFLQNEFNDSDYTQKIAMIINSCFNNKKDEKELEKNLERNAKLIQFSKHNTPENLLKQAKDDFTEKQHSFDYKGELNLGNILRPETE